MSNSEYISEEKIAEYLQLHDILSPEIFDAKDELLSDVKKTLQQISEFLTGYMMRIFQHVEIEDIILSGSRCYYNYQDSSKLDLIILLAPDEKIISREEFDRQFHNINEGLSARGYDFFINGVRVSYAWRTKLPESAGIYSLKKGIWIKKPTVMPYAFSAEGFQQELAEYDQKIQAFLSGLEKDDDGVLTMESCDKLLAFAEELRQEAHKPAVLASAKECGLAYNLYRYFKQFGFPNDLIQMAFDGYCQNLNK